MRILTELALIENFVRDHEKIHRVKDITELFAAAYVMTGENVTDKFRTVEAIFLFSGYLKCSEIKTHIVVMIMLAILPH